MPGANSASTNPSAHRPQRSQTGQPFSLLGQIVYENEVPVARIHSLAESPNLDHTEEIPNSIRVSAHLDHVEFDLSALSQVVAYVANAYPEGNSLVTGSDQIVNADHLFKNNDNTRPTSRIIMKRCVFVGAVFDFGERGDCIRFVDAFTVKAFWDTIRSVGCEDSLSYKGSLYLDSSHLAVTPGPSVGRFILVETISPEVVVALHIALEYYFAVTTAINLYAGWSTMTKGVQAEELIREATRRALHYTINFLYVVSHEDRLKLPTWHKTRTSALYDDKLPTDYYIGQGTTVLQMSEDLPRENSEHSEARFRPWCILLLPAVPRIRTWREDHAIKDAQLANSAEAWIWTIWNEHRIVYAELYDLFQHISDKVSPPKDFMFNLSHIDKLIFDDENYTKSKLYFWAYQSLELIQQQVTTIIRRWAQYRSHVDLNHPGRTARKRKATAYNARLEELFHDMDLCIEDFREFVKDCKAKQHEIAALRDGLFNGSAVLESRNSVRTADQSLQQTRTAISQGENIRILTLVSIFFLPLAFVTSVFGMTNLPASGDMSAFAISLVCICIPAYIVIGFIMDLWRPALEWLLNRFPENWRTPRYHVFRTMIIRDMTRETVLMALGYPTVVGPRTRPNALPDAQNHLGESANQANQSPESQQQGLYDKIGGDDKTKWNFKVWNRASVTKDIGNDRDVELAEGLESRRASQNSPVT